MQAALQTSETIELWSRLNKLLSVIQDVPDAVNLLHLHCPSARRSHQKKLKIYQHNLGVVSTAFTDLTATISVVGRNINVLRANLHRATMPIYSLPNEILCLIFEMVCFNEPLVTAKDIIQETRPSLQKPWIALSSVCAQWRDVVREHHPRLCSQLSFRSDDSFSTIDTLLRVSREHLVDLQLHSRDSKYFSSQVAPVAITHRLRSLTVDFPTGYARFFQQRVVYAEPPDISDRFPHLESLCIVNNRAYPEDLPDSLCEDLLGLPNLKSLSLVNCPNPPEWLLTSTLYTCGARLKEIALKTVQFVQPGDLQALLENHPCLEKLRLEEASYAPPTFHSPVTNLGFQQGPHGANGNNINAALLNVNDNPAPHLGSDTNEALGQGAEIQTGNLRVLEIINCSVRFTQSILNRNIGRHRDDAEAGNATAIPISPFRNLTRFSLDFGHPEYSYAEISDRFDKVQENEIEFAVDNLGLDRLFGEDLSWRKEMWREWGCWKACCGLFDAFFDDMKSLDSLELCGPPAIVTHVLDALDRTSAAALSSITFSIPSDPTHPSVSLRCPRLQAVGVRVPPAHKRYIPEQIEPLRQALCTFLNRSLLPIPMATAAERGHERRQFMRLAVPMCLSEGFGTLEPTIRLDVMGNGCHHLHGSHARGDEDGIAGSPTLTRNYVVERLQSCVFGRLCRR